MKKDNNLERNKEYLSRLSRDIGANDFSDNGNNIMVIFGTMINTPSLMEVDGEEYYQFLVKVDRKSDKNDIIPVWLVKNNLTTGISYLPIGTEITIMGEYRSTNWTDEEGKRHLELYLRAEDYYQGTVHRDDEFDNNIVIMDGYICTAPKIKSTYTNRKICDFIIAVNDGINEPEYFPVIAWGSKAEEVFNHYRVGDGISMLGRVQSREYHKGEQSFIAYEISSRFIKRFFSVRNHKYPFRVIEPINNNQYGYERSAM